MSALERKLRKFQFFEKRVESEWSGHFRDYVLSAGVDEAKFDHFTSCFATLWEDGKSRRQGSPEMVIKST